MSRTTICLFFLAVATVFDSSRAIHAQTLGTPFSSHYTLVKLGTAPGVLQSYGGITVNPFNTNQILLGSDANTTSGTIKIVNVTRDSTGHINGFTGTTTQLSTARGSLSGGIDGGLQYGPDNVLFYTNWSSNEIGQIKFGSSAANKFVSLSGLGISSSTGGLSFVPNGFANAGHLKITSYGGGFIYDTTITADGTGTFNISAPTSSVSIGGFPEGLSFVKGGIPDFAVDSMLISDYSSGTVKAYNLDANSNPIVSSARTFISGMTWAEGSAIDPVTGDFLFTQFGSSSAVTVVRPIAVPEPSSFLALGFGAGLFYILRRRRMKQ